MENESGATSALRFICPHAERASYNISISVPVVSATYDQVSVKACKNCAASMVKQVLDSLVEFQGQLVTQTNITIFQGDLELSLTSKFLNEVEGDSGTVEIELGGLVPLQDKVSLHWNLFCHPQLTNQLQSVRW